VNFIKSVRDDRDNSKTTTPRQRHCGNKNIAVDGSVKFKRHTICANDYFTSLWKGAREMNIKKELEKELEKNIRWIALKSGKTNKQVMDDIKKFDKIFFEDNKNEHKRKNY
jgi:hypothetical protein